MSWAKRVLSLKWASSVFVCAIIVWFRLYCLLFVVYHVCLVTKDSRYSSEISGVARICCEEGQSWKLGHGALTANFSSSCSMTNSFMTNAVLIERAVSCWHLHKLISQTTQYLDSWLSDLLQSEPKIKLLEVEGGTCPIAGDATVRNARENATSPNLTPFKALISQHHAYERTPTARMLARLRLLMTTVCWWWWNARRRSSSTTPSTDWHRCSRHHATSDVPCRTSPPRISPDSTPGYVT